MRGPDLDRERSEKTLTAKEFVACYNDGLPTGYPPVTVRLVKLFSAAHPHLFKKGDDDWSLDQHRKRVMDWLPTHLRKIELAG